MRYAIVIEKVAPPHRGHVGLLFDLKGCGLAARGARGR